jgi:hypothetical protein
MALQNYESIVHCVQFSTGIGSAEVVLRVQKSAKAQDRIVLLTADTMAEDEDNWRFAKEFVKKFAPSSEWIIIRDGRTPLQIGRDKKIVPNNRMAVCSQFLKREPLARWIKHNLDPKNSILYFGFDWTEEQRHNRAAPLWKPYKVDSPLLKKPFLEKSALLNKFNEMGIKPPRLYSVGFSHANCGGACVRGGQASWKLLLDWNPIRFKEWENEEEKSRIVLKKDVAILKESVNNTVIPLTLRNFRERLETQPSLFDSNDWGACGCFAGVEE